MIYLAFDSKRETDSDRQILRQIYANQKLHLFGKDDLQIKLFAQEIIESISKFWSYDFGNDFLNSIDEFFQEGNRKIQ